MICRHCREPIRETPDPNVPYVHTASHNAGCDVTDPVSAVFLAAFNPTGMRQEAAPLGALSTPVGELRPGDLVDLEGDEYAERECSPGCESCELNRVSFEYELATVAHVEHETDGCVRVDFESVMSVGFPADHELLRMAFREVGA